MSCRYGRPFRLLLVLGLLSGCADGGTAWDGERRVDALSAEVTAALLLPNGHHAKAVSLTGEGTAFVVGFTEGAPDGVASGFVARVGDGSVQSLRYLGGGAVGGGVTTIEDVAVGANGTVFVTGYSSATELPTTAGAFAPDRPVAPSAFVFALRASDLEVTWGSWLGGGVPEPREGYGPLGPTIPTGLVVDAENRPHVTGHTGAPDFPTTSGVLQETRGGCGTRICPQVAFVTAFSADGSQLAFSTLFGGDADTYPAAIGLDATGRVWVTGDAPARQFFGGPQIRDGFPERPGDWETWPDDAFLARIQDDGATLGLALYLGAAEAAPASGSALDLDVRGSDVLVVGAADAPDFATAGAAAVEFTGFFAASYSLEGAKVWASFVEAQPLAVTGRPAGDVAIVGATGAPMTRDAYVGVLEGDGSALTLATVIEGAGDDVAWNVAAGRDDVLWVVGDTSSEDFPYGEAPPEGPGAFLLGLQTSDDGDGGTPDAGPDSGVPDAGPSDGGVPDGGRPDGGQPDGGPADAGRHDGGPADAGPHDGGPADAGFHDGGPGDAGPHDGGPGDAGTPDAGSPDAGAADGGAPVNDAGGCGCTGSGGSGLAWGLVLALWPAFRRRLQRKPPFPPVSDARAGAQTSVATGFGRPRSPAPASPSRRRASAAPADLRLPERTAAGAPRTASEASPPPGPPRNGP